MLLKIKKPDNTVLLKNGIIMCIQNMKLSFIESNYENILLQGFVLQKIKSIFKWPTQSADFNMYRVRYIKNIVNCRLIDVKAKMMNIDLSESIFDNKKSYVIPLLHM